MSFVETLKIIVFGLVEGFTEWLPISSTGHMILVNELINLIDRYRPFMAGSEHSVLDLRTVILLSGIIFLYDDQRNGLHFFISCKTF